MSTQPGAQPDQDGRLSERHRAMLDFERTWWQLDASREDVIGARFGCSADEYDVELHRVLELPEAMVYDPVVVRRFDRRRQRRRRALLDTGTGSSAETAFDWKEGQTQ